MKNKNLFVALAAFCLIVCGFFSFSLYERLFCPVSSLLKKVEFADKAGIVLREKTILVRGVKNPYNPSIVKWKDNRYLVVFRYDIPKETEQKKTRRPGYYTKIGIAELDQNFEQTEKEFREIDTGSLRSEDPRIFALNGKYYLLFNDRVGYRKKREYRSMHVALLNTETWSLEFITSLDQQIKPIEKNWVPIIREGKEELLLGYSINPTKIIGVSDLKKNEIVHHVYDKVPSFGNVNWWQWGELRGGTPALQVGDEYVAFFHSFFQDPRHPIRYWYVMGAYAFQAKEPFALTRLSKAPLLFNTLYSEEVTSPFADKRKRVAYPSGFVTGVENGREVFYVSLGVNDSQMKIMVIDKENLYKSMQEVTPVPTFPNDSKANFSPK